ncbi:MAG: PAS domain S-box protein [Cyclobacteriaceae bacterium]|nr:PAS domain S-box protein [Cyclobacteriaceae bacterium]
MNPTTAFGFLLLSIAILFFHTATLNKRHIAYVLTLLCFCIGALRLIGEQYKWFFQIDQLIFANKISDEISFGMQDRMAPSSALNFIILSLALFTQNTPKPNHFVSQGLATIACLISWFSILGYMYRVPEFYGEIPFFPMAVHTAGGFVLLSCALITTHPDRAFCYVMFGPYQGSVLGRSLLPGIFLIPVVLGYIRLWGHWLNIVSTEFGVALLMVSLTLIFATGLLLAMRLLNKHDEKQIYFQQNLIDLNSDLKVKHDEVTALNKELQAANEELAAANEELSTLNDSLHMASKKINEQAEIIVQQKEEQLNRVLDSSQDVIWSIDLTGNGKTYISRSIENVFGEMVTDNLLKNFDFWMERTHPEDRKKKELARQQMIDTGHSECNYRMRIANNSYRWIYERSRLIYDNQRKPIRHEGIVTDLTVLKNQEEAIQRYQENLDIIFNNTVEEILLLDENGQIMLFNAALERFILNAKGRPPQIGNFLWDIAVNDRVDASKSLFTRALQGETIVVDASVKTKEGEVIHELRYQPVFIQEKVKYVTVTSIDVTDKKKQADILKKSEANLRAIFEHTIDAFVLLDAAYNIVSFNRSALGISGLDLKKGKSIFDFIEIERHENFRTNLERASLGATVEYNTQVSSFDNTTWYHVSISAIIVDQNLVGFCITTHDYSSLKRAEALLKESEERFRALVENSEDIIGLANKNGQIVYLNPSIEHISGYKADEFLFAKSEEYIHPDDKDLYITFWNSVFESRGKLMHGAFRMKSKNLTWRWLEGTAINLSEKDNVEGIIINFKDVTERKKAEIEKTNLISQLTEQNYNLQQFSFIASHNLRGPVASILGLLQILKPVVVTEYVATIHQMIHKSVKNLDSVIRDLNDILDMRSYNLHEREPIILRDIVEIVCKTLHLELERTQAIILIQDDSFSTFHTIRSYFHSILLNLITNSIKYQMDDRNPVIRITTFHCEGNCGFTYQDNGKGIDLSLHGDKVFGLYKRFHQNTEGRGVGLYMVKTQVGLLNGEIKIESEPNIGTTFTVSFPLLDANS